MRILVCGGRDFKNYKFLSKVLNYYLLIFKDDFLVIEGGANGADKLAGKWAIENNIKLEEYPANWKEFGKNAGPIRNQKMIDEGKPDFVIAFPGGNGAADMIRRARRSNIPVKEIKNEEYLQVFDSEAS